MRHLCLCVLWHLCLVTGLAAAERQQVTPLIDHPLRDPSICQGPDGWYYLTGTDGTAIAPERGTDFLNNEGIRLWRSRDLQDWQALGLVFSINQDQDGGVGHNSPFQWRARPTALRAGDGPEVRGIHAPEIHYLKETFWITYSIAGWGGGLLKSTSGKPEGPYLDWGRCRLAYRPKPTYTSQLVFQGGSLSLFEDDDGQVYLLYGQGQIAPLSDDLRHLAAPPRLLQCENPAKTGEQAADYPLQVGREGFFLTRHEGRYLLFATDHFTRGSEACSDVYVAWSETLFGPYSERRWCITYAGQTTIFTGPEGQLLATYCGADPHAAFRDRAGIVPLTMTQDDFPTIFKPEQPFPRLVPSVNTTRYLFDRLPEITHHQMRDVQACRGPDGTIYYTGSHITAGTNGVLYIYSSRDMINWEAIPVWDWDRQVSAFTKAIKDPRGSKRPNVFSYMDTEIWYLGDTFYIGYAVYGARPSTYLLRSSSGTAAGPYVLHTTGIPSQPSFIEDEDGQIYCATNARCLAWKADMSGPVDGAAWSRISSTDGSMLIGDAAGQMIRVDGWYGMGSTGWAAEKHYQCTISAADSYSWNITYARALEGPWSREQALLYMGHGGLVEDRFGQWWACFFGCERSPGMPWAFCAPGIHPLERSLDQDGRPRFRLSDQLPAYAQEALDRRRR